MTPPTIHLRPQSYILGVGRANKREEHQLNNETHAITIIDPSGRIQCLNGIFGRSNSIMEVNNAGSVTVARVLMSHWMRRTLRLSGRPL